LALPSAFGLRGMPMTGRRKAQTPAARQGGDRVAEVPAGLTQPRTHATNAAGTG
jgi:hypothetical protein